jgi:hypothetical protein
LIAHGIPLTACLTAANRHDSQEALPLVDAIPPVWQSLRKRWLTR